MKRTTFLYGIGLISVGLLFWAATLLANAQAGTMIQHRNQATVESRTTWEYARLVINDEVVLWHPGESNIIPEPVTLDIQYRRLGGNFRANLTNLLNLIGSDGWELVATDETIWTFKRRR